MKHGSTLSERARRAALFGASFLLFLLTYVIYLILESAIGGGLAYLWFLTLVPSLFLLYELLIGWVSFCRIQSFWKTVLDQELALLFYLIFATAVDLFSGRTPVSELGFSHFLPDVIALLCCPVLTLIGARVSRFFATRKNKKQR